jgi:hypothetical protein
LGFSKTLFIGENAGDKTTEKTHSGGRGIRCPLIVCCQYEPIRTWDPIVQLSPCQTSLIAPIPETGKADYMREEAGFSSRLLDLHSLNLSFAFLYSSATFILQCIWSCISGK